jgi:hypothetical protein
VDEGAALKNENALGAVVAGGALTKPNADDVAALVWGICSGTGDDGTAGDDGASGLMKALKEGWVPAAVVAGAAERNPNADPVADGAAVATNANAGDTPLGGEVAFVELAIVAWGCPAVQCSPAGRAFGVTRAVGLAAVAVVVARGAPPWRSNFFFSYLDLIHCSTSWLSSFSDGLP